MLIPNPLLFQTRKYRKHAQSILIYFLIRKYLCNVYYVPGSVLNTLKILTHLILITTCEKCYYSLSSTDEETEAQRINNLPNGHSW